MRYRHIGLFFVGIMLAASAVADVLQLKEGYPETYVVKKGDTLWDISGHFLKKPWLWPRLWQVNPQVKDPHWIYPGDVLHLVWINGEPRLVSKHTVKLSPRVRVTQQEKPVPTIELARIAPFLRSSHVFGANENLDLLPFIMGNNRSQTAMMTGGTDTDFIVHGPLVAGQQYGIYHVGDAIKEKESEEVLGKKAELVGIAVAGDSAGNGMTHATLVKNIKEAKQGDRLLSIPSEENLAAYFTLRAGNIKKKGYIIDVPTEVRGVGKYDVVMLNVGSREGVASGDVFNIARPGVDILDGDQADSLSYKQFSSEGQKLFSAAERLPEDIVGQLMVFKVYEKTSLAIILRTSDLVKQDYDIRNP
jgi:Uncharacterized protein containing LysM domain